MSELDRIKVKLHELIKSDYDSSSSKSIPFEMNDHNIAFVKSEYEKHKKDYEEFKKKEPESNYACNYVRKYISLVKDQPGREETPMDKKIVEMANKCNEDEIKAICSTPKECQKYVYLTHIEQCNDEINMYLTKKRIEEADKQKSLDK